VMMRLRNARNLDSRQTNAIDNAYFACRPPDKAASRRRKRSPMQVRCLAFEGGARRGGCMAPWGGSCLMLPSVQVCRLCQRANVCSGLGLCTRVHIGAHTALEGLCLDLINTLYTHKHKNIASLTVRPPSFLAPSPTHPDPPPPVCRGPPPPAPRSTSTT
jgi:hypothetical protein